MSNATKAPIQTMDQLADQIAGLPVKKVKNAKPVEGKVVNITNNDDAKKALARLKELKAIESAAAKAKKEREDVIEPLLREVLGDAEQFVVRGVTIAKLSSQRTNESYSKNILLTAFPEAEQAAKVTTEYNFITVL